jgi:hypothetical protein
VCCLQESVNAKTRMDGTCKGAAELVSVINGKVSLRKLVEALQEVKLNKLASSIWSSAGAYMAS